MVCARREQQISELGNPHQQYDEAKEFERLISMIMEDVWYNSIVHTSTEVWMEHMKETKSQWGRRVGCTFHAGQLQGVVSPLQCWEVNDDG